MSRNPCSENWLPIDRNAGFPCPGTLASHVPEYAPLLGCQSFNLPTLTEGEYIDLVDYTGRQIYPGKRGTINESEPKALDKLGLNAEHWAHRIQAFGEGFGAKWFRVIGELEDMIEKTKEIKQRTLFGIGLARHLAKG